VKNVFIILIIHNFGFAAEDSEWSLQ